MSEVTVAITIKAWRRPAYFKRVVEGLAKALDFFYKFREEETRADLMFHGYPTKGVVFKYLIVSLDYAPEAIVDAQSDILEPLIAACNRNHIHNKIVMQPTTLGCAGNTEFVLTQGFNAGSDAVIHLEDDTVPALDFLVYLAKKLLYISTIGARARDYFAICPFNRTTARDKIPCDIILENSYTKAWFECGGGFLMPRKTWDLIIAEGGMFGAVGNANRPDLVGLPWKESILVTDKGSWAWPMNQYFRQRSLTEHLCIFPAISRVQNIGQLGGVFNPSARWHKENILDPNWAGTYSPDQLMLASRQAWSTNADIVLPT